MKTSLNCGHKDKCLQTIIRDYAKGVVFIDFPLETMASLAPSSKFYRTKHGFPLTEDLKSQLRAVSYEADMHARYTALRILVI